MKPYLDIVQRILDEGVSRPTRTGIDAVTIAGATFEHDMQEGFPLLTTKKMPFRSVASELEFFIQGHTDKKWLQDQGNHIWDEWCNPEQVPYGLDPETQRRMREERDLGPVYGWQWRHFGAEYKGHNANYTGQGVDQLQGVIDTIKKDPMNRRMMVTAWNPLDLKKMALPACHYNFQVTVIGGRLNLLWNQRSVDTMLGLPFNIASYGLLLHLLAKETNLQEGRLVGFLADVHIYENHFEGAKEQLSRESLQLPKVETREPTSALSQNIFAWCHTDTKVQEYKSYGKIEFNVAV